MARLVRKEYFEDVDEEAGYAYRYWDLVVDVDGEEFGVRIYRDEPDKASIAVSPRPVDDAQHAALRALARYLEENEGAKLHVLGDSGSYEELEAAIERKLAREKRPLMHTLISRVFPDRVEVRGRDLADHVMGQLSFTEYFHLLLTGDEPTEDERYFLDVLLVSIAEHGMMPTNVAARMTLAADPNSLQGAVAAGILGAGPVILGTSHECARLLTSGREPLAVVREIRDAGGRVPGFGHPVHEPVDPRAERILELADERGVSGPHIALARRFRDAVAEVWGRPLTMNVSMPIAAVMLDLGFPASAVKAVPILARTAGLLAHLAEEQERPLGFVMARAAEEAAEHER